MTDGRFAVDPTRVLFKNTDNPTAKFDRSAPDSVWVPVCGRTLDSVSGADAQREAASYVANKFGISDGVDKIQGPLPDDGMSLPALEGEVSEASGLTSAEDYLNAAAKGSTIRSGDKRYVQFYRFRRFHLLG